MADTQRHDTWIEIDTRIIRANILKLGQRARSQNKDFMLMVKANAYGHGLVPIASLAEKAGAKFLGVTNLEDAATMRRQGITAHILLFNEPHPDDIPALDAHAVTPVISSLSFLQKFVKSADMERSFHVKINTGLNRFGLRPDDMPALIALIAEHPHLNLEGLLTHYSSADSDLATTRRQLEQFLACVDVCHQAGLDVKYVHASNSAATSWLDEQSTNLVRLGLAAYGLQPSADKRLDVAQGFIWKARLIAVSEIKRGEKVGYSGTWTAARNGRIGVIGVGYYDGFRRSPANFSYVLCRGKKVPIVGNVMMNHAMLDLTDVPADVGVNEEIVLIGSQDTQRITFEDVARHTGTINEEIATAARDTIPRIYLS